MRKRLGLFIIGFVLALGAFFLYQYATNATFLPQKAPKGPDVIVSTGDRSQTYEFRKKSTGELKYIITVKSFDAVKDKDGNPIPGQYTVSEPSATFYQKDGRTVNLRADTGNVVLDQLPKAVKTTSSGSSSEGADMDLPPFQVRVGTLSGNVLLTVSAKPYISGDPKPTDGELTVAFDGDVQIFQNQNLITSSAPVHFRSDVLVYDG
jgi:lipopolysaccharide export system protein LptC